MGYTVTVLVFYGTIVSANVEQERPKSGSGMQQIQIAIDEVKQEKNVTQRVEDAHKVVALVKRYPSAAGNNEAVAQLTDLLGDPVDGVRYWAATALGYIGPKAEAAIPALERAYQAKKDSTQSKTSASAIRVALKRIKCHRYSEGGGEDDK